MQRLSLTTRLVASLPTPDKERVIWDAALIGFGVRCYPSGRKVYVLRTWHQGRFRKQKLETIGDAVIITADEAKAEARLRLRDLHFEIDCSPQEDTITFSELAARYMRDHARLRKRSWKEDERRLTKYLLPAFATKPISSITRADVAALHNEIGSEFPFAANRVKEQLSMMFGLAKLWMLVPDNHTNPTHLIPDFPEPRRTRWLKPPEVTRLSRSLQQEEDPYVVAYIYLLLLTSLRKKELLNLQWCQVDDERLEVTERKNDAPLTVPLPKEARALLSLLPRQLGNPYIFCGRRPGRPLQDVKSQWKRICKRANLTGVRIHDLRHTVATWLKKQGRRLDEIMVILGQKSIASAAGYVHDYSDDTQAHLQLHANVISAHFAGLPECLLQSNHSLHI